MKRVKIITDHPIAYNHDHNEPKGTRGDNLHSDKFVDTIIKLFGKDIAYLDLGTAGGGLPKDFIDRDVLGIGIDGSDYSLKHKRAEWETIPDYLFTADITKPYHFIEEDTNEQVKFKVVSSFDVLEHIAEELLPGLIENLHNNMVESGYFINSIAEFEDTGYHVTLHPKEWWIDYFGNRGFLHEEIIGDEEYARKSSFQLTFRKI